MNDVDPCLDERGTSVLSSETLIARRKRMEIRRIKKSSRSTTLRPDTLFPVAENSSICIKRARIERATTTESFFDVFEANGTLRSFSDTDGTPLNLVCDGKDATNLNDFVVLSDKPVPLGKSSLINADGALPRGVRTAGPRSTNKGQHCSSLPVVPKDQESERGYPSVGMVCDTSDSGASSSMDVGPEGLQSDTFDPLARSNSPGSNLLQEKAATSDFTVDRTDAEIGDVGICIPNATPSTQLRDYISINNPRHHSCPPCSKLLLCGRRREMEDTATIAPSFSQVGCGIAGNCVCPEKFEPRPFCDLHFFAVYDGHGGSQASTYCMERLHHALADELAGLGYASKGDLESSDDFTASFTWKRVMETCFSKVDREVGGVCRKGQCNDLCDGTLTCCGDSIAPENAGTIAVVAVNSSCLIVVANCGDSRAVLSRGGVAIPLSIDHKPERDDETSRIEAAGGRVIYWDGYRVGGLLALSRSIGDGYLKQYVVSEPEVTRLQRTDDDECLILASDGLWGVVNNDTACQIARKCLDATRKNRSFGSFAVGADPASAAVAALLVKLAYGRGSKDNIGVVVIDLKS